MSSRALRWTMVAVAILGVLLAGYLTYVHYEGIKPLCTAGETCLKVQSSIYSKLAGIPVADMGLAGYLLILALLLVPQSERTRLGCVMLTGGGFAFSLYLTYREVFTLEEICEECAASAVLMTVLFLLSIWRFLRGADGPIRSAETADGPAGSIRGDAPPPAASPG